jgi:hypothetical protein
VPHAPRTGVNVDQVLDLAIAKLRAMVPPDAASEIATASVHFPFLSSGGRK